MNTISILKDGNAGNLAEKHVLRVALRKLDPKHPLLTNTMLQEKIKEEGRRVMAKTELG